MGQTLLAAIRKLIPPGCLSFVDIPVSRVKHMALRICWLWSPTHWMAIQSTSVGVDHMLKGRMLSLLALQYDIVTESVSVEPCV